MTMMSLSAYAATHGVKKQSAAEWKARGFLVMSGALVDADASDKKMKAGAKGRFRVKAHGGKRRAGVRGAIDRPGAGYVGGVQVGVPAAPAEPLEPEERYVRPHHIAARLRSAYEDDDAELMAEQLALVEWWQLNDDAKLIRWARWPAAMAPTIAAELGLVGKEADVEDVLRRHVLAMLGVDHSTVESDLADMEPDLLAVGADLEVKVAPLLEALAPR